MSKLTDKLIDDILELILGDMGCRHEQDHDEDGVHMSVEYSLNDETKLRGKIKALLKPEVTEEWIEEKAIEFYKKFLYVLKPLEHKDIKDFIRLLVGEII